MAYEPHAEPTPHRPLNRRALLTGGLLGAGALAGLSAAPPAAAAATGSAGPVVYGPAPSTDANPDDAPALQSALYALPIGGTLLLPAGTYHLGGLVYVPAQVDLVGSGGGNAGPATVLQCTTADAGLHVWGGGGLTGDFVVDGNAVATTPFTRGFEGGAVGRTFIALSVVNSAGDGVVCLGSQNDAWYLLTVHKAARDCLVLDQGYGGALFSKCEVNTGGRFNLRIDTQVGNGPYPSPSDNVFHQCIFEYNDAGAQSIAYIRGGWANKFDHTSFYASQKTSGPVIDVLGGSTQLVFEDAAIQSTGSTVGGIGLQVDWGCGVTLAGMTHFQNFDTAIYLHHSAGAPSAEPFIDTLGTPLYYYCTNRVDADPSALPAGKTAEHFVSNLQVQHVETRRRFANDLAYVSRVGTAAFYAVVETADGQRTWGDGKSATGDVSLGRRGPGVLGVDGGDLFATGYGSTADRPAPTSAAAGALRVNTDARRLEASDGSGWFAPSQHAASFTASGSFVVPDGVTALRCRVLGGGGGGGGGGTIGATSKSTGCYGGAGGGAGMIFEQLLDVTPGETLTITIGGGGAGGAGGTASGTSTGHAGATGRAGGATSVKRGTATLLLAPGGGGGTAGPAATATGPVAPTSGGAFGCSDVSTFVAPGSGGFANRSALPAPGGVCGGASGARASTTRGGASGTAPTAPGQRATAGSYTSSTKNGLAGARPTAPGCGGNGGGAGARGGAGGAGGAGSGGRVDLWWVV